MEYRLVANSHGFGPDRTTTSKDDLISAYAASPVSNGSGSIAAGILNSYPPSQDFVNNPDRYSVTPPSCSPTHSHEPNLPSALSETLFSSYGPSYSLPSSSLYLPTPASLVRNLPVTSSVPSSYPSLVSLAAFRDRYHWAFVPLSMHIDRCRLDLLGLSPSSPALTEPTPLQQPTPPFSIPPPPPLGQADDKEQAKPDTASAPASPGTSAATAAQKAEKKHVCATCSRPFSTSSHLAGHTCVYTGERNHKCPFPGCETRFSRQDNLQQHYRIQLSPKSWGMFNSPATRAAVACVIESAVHDDMSSQGVHATHPSPHPNLLPYPPPHPHYAAAPSYGAYPQHLPNGSSVYPG
ncbi:transcriptional repressor [Ceratobasidium sp. 395]|nr:transcriptional repressor [Ceratobasidium sp. 395]